MPEEIKKPPEFTCPTCGCKRYTYSAIETVFVCYEEVTAEGMIGNREEEEFELTDETLDCWINCIDCTKQYPCTTELNPDNGGWIRRYVTKIDLT
jgi:hypothetical protein